MKNILREIGCSDFVYEHIFNIKVTYESWDPDTYRLELTINLNFPIENLNKKIEMQKSNIEWVISLGMGEKDKQTQPPPPEQNSDFIEDEFEDTENTSSASYKPPAKDWDTALLVDCSARRLRVICKDYPGCPAKSNKEQIYQFRRIPCKTVKPSTL